MIEINKLTEFNSKQLLSFGHIGYKSNAVYKLEQNSSDNEIVFVFKYIKLECPYIKTYLTNDTVIATYTRIISEGNSFGAYDKQRLVGVVIAEKREWNNSLWIELILVAERERGKGIGASLLKKLIQNASNKNIRVISLETQNTNVPAINFYRKNGFEISGLNINLYKDLESKDEIAIYMTKTLLIID